MRRAGRSVVDAAQGVESAYLAASRLAAAEARGSRRRRPVEQQRAERSMALAELDGSGAIPVVACRGPEPAQGGHPAPADGVGA